jgi:hypothetical protein
VFKNSGVWTSSTASPSTLCARVGELLKLRNIKKLFYDDK